VWKSRQVAGVIRAHELTSSSTLAHAQYCTHFPSSKHGQDMLGCRHTQVELLLRPATHPHSNIPTADPWVHHTHNAGGLFVTFARYPHTEHTNTAPPCTCKCAALHCMTLHTNCSLTALLANKHSTHHLSPLPAAKRTHPPSITHNAADAADVQ
jgi:hypothetical protein